MYPTVARQLSVSKDGTAVHLDGGSAGQNLNAVLMDRKGNSSVLVSDQPDAQCRAFLPTASGSPFSRVQVTSGIRPGAQNYVSRNAWYRWRELASMDARRPAAHLCASSQRVERLRQSILLGSRRWIEVKKPLTPDTILNAYPSSWSPDGRILAFQRLSAKDGSCCEIWTVSVDEAGKPGEAHQVPGVARGFAPALSPDGHWLAYTSPESGSVQVFVVPFPGPGGNGKSPPAADSTHAGRRAVTNCSIWMGVRSSRCPTPSRKAHSNRENPRSSSRTASRCALR